MAQVEAAAAAAAAAAYAQGVSLVASGAGGASGAAGPRQCDEPGCVMLCQGRASSCVDHRRALAMRVNPRCEVRAQALFFVFFVFASRAPEAPPHRIHAWLLIAVLVQHGPYKHVSCLRVT